MTTQQLVIYTGLFSGSAHWTFYYKKLPPPPIFYKLYKKSNKKPNVSKNYNQLCDTLEILKIADI